MSDNYLGDYFPRYYSHNYSENNKLDIMNEGLKRRKLMYFLCILKERVELSITDRGLKYRSDKLTLYISYMLEVRKKQSDSIYLNPLELGTLKCD